VHDHDRRWSGTFSSHRARSYSDPDNPDNRVLLISVRVQSRGRIASQCHRSDRRREPMRVIVLPKAVISQPSRG
jgi:hypothetical protein